MTLHGCDEFGRPLSGAVQHHLGRALRDLYARQPPSPNERIDELLRRLARAEAIGEAAEGAADDEAGEAAPRGARMPGRRAPGERS